MLPPVDQRAVLPIDDQELVALDGVIGLPVHQIIKARQAWVPLLKSSNSWRGRDWSCNGSQL